MTAKEGERIARLEEAYSNVSSTLSGIDEKVDKLTSRLDNLTGGKRALMWMAGILVAVTEAWHRK